MINWIITYGLGLLGVLLVILAASNIIISVLSFAPWVPSRSRDLARILKLADLRGGQTFYDLGCGDGKVVFYAGKNFPVKAIGMEISFPLYLFCLLKNLFYFNSNIKFKFKNLFNVNLSDADVVYFFGMPHSLNEKFSDKLRDELKPGAKIISYSFKLKGWTPKVIDKPTGRDLSIYLYEA